ncbi:MAG: peptidoglycan DD-metalloendopeptidase family protein [Actinobacteria bacterium]|uniref:Unannotated protein n=1 Tax=freshwater metagenome TaxID=449393 RepID=A0A6J6A3M2_9ZZZZ|nr:peptidoglycan DD-metalloendopeptidase family protein [Actinomycetota bacterium]MSW76163.1 peptidoglycan DD-metalloendopeptidase family protein [Actinomycetota bacterium]MSX92735.1 peptidoglycan DD-metalloendopeptidase family protein [Actinomycetota bacterium]MSZ81873.1 peptidoglycan DD-metalloendopeptidase family protein [Actinomycetota bacterium]MTB16712.1 peptidoglycan DD-metalloendopeptidase family protein [Actinomycetota bacterium]
MIAALVVAMMSVIGGCLSPPVQAPVSVPFRAPACRYCAGHRGLEYVTSPGTPVTAVAAGTVTFAGRVAGTGYVVVRQPDGLAATYGFVTALVVHEGQWVQSGQIVAHSTGRLYFGWRRGAMAVDPTPSLAQWRAAARLVPRDGTARRPVATHLLCPASVATGRSAR